MLLPRRLTAAPSPYLRSRVSFVSRDDLACAAQHVELRPVVERFEGVLDSAPSRGDLMRCGRLGHELDRPVGARPPDDRREPLGEGLTRGVVGVLGKVTECFVELRVGIRLEDLPHRVHRLLRVDLGADGQERTIVVAQGCGDRAQASRHVR